MKFNSHPTPAPTRWVCRPVTGTGCYFCIYLSPVPDPALLLASCVASGGSLSASLLSRFLVCIMGVHCWAL